MPILARLLALAFLAVTAQSVLCQPPPPRYRLLDKTITFSLDAVDDDLRFLDDHREITSVAFRGPNAWSGRDPREVPFRITAAGFARLAARDNLEELTFDGQHPMPIGDDALKHLAKLTRLRTLNLGGTPFTDVGTALLAGLTNLTEFSANSNKLGDGTPAALAGNKQLRVLHLYRVPITDAGLARIVGLTALEDLQLGHARITDEGLKTIANFTKLKTLDLQHTR